MGHDVIRDQQGPGTILSMSSDGHINVGYIVRYSLKWSQMVPVREGLGLAMRLYLLMCIDAHRMRIEGAIHPSLVVLFYS